MRFAIDHIIGYLNRTAFNPWLMLTFIPRIWMEENLDLGLFKRAASQRSPKLLLVPAIHFITSVTSILMIIPPLIGLLMKATRWLNFYFVDSGIKDTYDWPKEIAVITGGSGAIGSATVARLLKMGVGKVVILDVMDPEPELIKDDRVHFYHCDVTEYENVQKTAFQIKKQIGVPTILIITAGIVHPATLISGAVSNQELTFKVNVLGALWALKCFVPAMIIPNHGHVLTITSQLGHLSVPMTVDYCASKAALGALIEGFQAEVYNYYRGSRIRFSSIAPGLVDTPLVTNNRLPNTFLLPWLTAEDMAGKICEILEQGDSKNVCFPIGAYATLGLRLFPDWVRWLAQYIFARLQVMTYLKPRRPPLKGFVDEMLETGEGWPKPMWDTPALGKWNYYS